MRTGRRKLWRLMLKKSGQGRGRGGVIYVLPLFLLSFVLVLVSGCQKKDRPLSIGAPDDAGGIIVEYLAREKVDFLQLKEGFELYPLKDCCSSTSSWALSSKEVDMAVICPEAARELVGKDPRYVIYGPVLANSDVFLVREDAADVKKVGYVQNRWYQKRLIEQEFKRAEPVPMLGASLPYALEKKAVDGIIVDVTKCDELRGNIVPVCQDNQEVITYVLVVDREIVDKPDFRKLMHAWQEAVLELNDDKKLREFWFENNKTEEMEIWKKAGTKFLQPLQEEDG